MGICSTCTNHGFRFHEPDSSTCSCRPRQPPASMNAWPLWKLSWPVTGGPGQVARGDRLAVEHGHDADPVGATANTVAAPRGHAEPRRVVGGDHLEQRRVDPVGARGEERELPALLAAALAGTPARPGSRRSRPRARGCARAGSPRRLRRPPARSARAARSPSARLTTCTATARARSASRAGAARPGSPASPFERDDPPRGQRGPNFLMTRPDSSSPITSRSPRRERAARARLRPCKRTPTPATNPNRDSCLNPRPLETRRHRMRRANQVVSDLLARSPPRRNSLRYSVFNRRERRSSGTGLGPPPPSSARAGAARSTLAGERAPRRRRWSDATSSGGAARPARVLWLGARAPDWPSRGPTAALAL